MKVGDKLRIVASENPTTGYGWIFNLPEEIDEEHEVYSIESNSYIPSRIGDSEGRPPMVGVGGQRVI